MSKKKKIITLPGCVDIETEAKEWLKNNPGFNVVGDQLVNTNTNEYIVFRYDNILIPMDMYWIEMFE